jgi:hypothetical protein
MTGLSSAGRDSIARLATKLARLAKNGATREKMARLRKWQFYQVSVWFSFNLCLSRLYLKLILNCCAIQMSE